MNTALQPNPNSVFPVEENLLTLYCQNPECNFQRRFSEWQERGSKNKSCPRCHSPLHTSKTFDLSLSPTDDNWYSGQ